LNAIVGLSRLTIAFKGQASHAGTTPMATRRDAVTAAAEWIVDVEREASALPGLVATVGRVESVPGVVNVIAGECVTSLDVRHADDTVRRAAVDMLLTRARAIGDRRRVDVEVTPLLEQPAVPMHPGLSAALERGVRECKMPVHRMGCGAGHDAMIMARRMPAAMLLMRSPGGISHHPSERVFEGDVAAALRVGCRLLEILEKEVR
jgi:allantoate deiminase